MKWKEEGYSIIVDERNDWGRGRETIVIIAKHPSHGIVGYANFAYNNNIPEIKPWYTVIQSEHRRKGLATAMYLCVEEITGLKLQPSDDQSSDAKLFWNHFKYLK